MLLVVVLVMLLLAGACLGAVAGVVHALRVQNRVVPSRRSTAPLVWLAAPSAAAHLHRRLKVAVTGARAAVATPGAAGLGLVEVVHELGARAEELDRQIVIASRSPQWARRQMLAELESEVHELERLAERVIRMSRAWGGSSPPEERLAAVRERLDVLESALRQLDGIDVPQTADGPVAPRHQPRL